MRQDKFGPARVASFENNLKVKAQKGDNAFDNEVISYEKSSCLDRGLSYPAPSPIFSNALYACFKSGIRLLWQVMNG
jgi:hypothetical protein